MQKVEFDYMPNNFHHWNETKQFKAAIYYLQNYQPQPKITLKTEKMRLQALILHGSRGSIRDNEEIEDALRMDDQYDLLNELHTIKDLSINQAKKEYLFMMKFQHYYRFINSILKINSQWYKDVKFMLKFLENQNNIYDKIGEDYKSILNLEEIKSDKNRDSIQTPLTLNKLDHSENEIYLMNRSIRRDYHKIQDIHSDRDTQHKNYNLTARTRQEPEAQAIFKLLSDNQNQLLSKILKKRGKDQVKVWDPLNRGLSSSQSQRLLIGSSLSQQRVALTNKDQEKLKIFQKNPNATLDLRDQLHQTKIHAFRHSESVQLGSLTQRNNQELGGTIKNLRANISSTPDQTKRQFDFKTVYDERLMSGNLITSREGIFQKTQVQQLSDNQSDQYYINKIVEKTIKKEIKNQQFQQTQSNYLSKVSNIQLQDPIPIKFAGDMLLQNAKLKPSKFQENDKIDFSKQMEQLLALKEQQDIQINKIEKSQNLNDLNLDEFNEEVVRDQSQIDQIFRYYVQQKEGINKRESQFVSLLHLLMNRKIDIVQQYNWKLRESQERTNIDSIKLKGQVQNFIDAIKIVKDNKGMQDYDLFGKGKITEEQLMTEFHQTKCQLQVADQELALKQAKLLDEFYEFIHSQEKKIISAKQKIDDLEKEMEHHRRKAHEQLQKAYFDNQEICKLSDALKEKIEQTNFQQDNHLESLYSSRQKLLNDELEKETKEKLQAFDRLRKKKDEIRKLKESLLKLTSKKHASVEVQCKMELEEKMKYHTRPKPPVTKLSNLFEDVIHGTSQKKIPTTKVEQKNQSQGTMMNQQQATKAIMSSGAKAVVQSKEWVQGLINLLYIDKIKTDMEEFREGKPIQSMRDFVIQWFLVKFGIKKVAEALLQDFIKSLINYEPIHERFRTFLIFCGVHIQKGLNRNRDKKSDLLYEKQLESIDTLRIYLKLVHTIRNGCTPFLPDINCDGSQRFQNGVVINYNESKNIFLQIMIEEGFNVNEHFSNLDTPFQEFLEDQMIFNDPKSKKMSYLQQQNSSLKPGGIQASSRKQNSQDDKYINIDVFLRICVMEFVKIRLNQVDQILSALKILEFNNYCDILYKDFETSVKIALYNKSEKWIEGAFTYLITNLEDSYFTREDVVITMLPWIHSTAFVKEYTMKHKAWIYVKELEKMNVIDSNWNNSNKEEEKKSQNQSQISGAVKQTSKFSPANNGTPNNNLKLGSQFIGGGSSKINIPKSIVPGTKLLKDPLSSAFILERNFKIMASFFSSVESDLKEINQLYNLIMEKVTLTRKSFVNQVENLEVAAQDENSQKTEAQMIFLTGNQKFIKTCQVIPSGSLSEQQDQTNEGWNLFRQLLYIVVSRHKNIDI
eukprot:403367891